MCRNAADFRFVDVHPRVLLVGACPGREEERDGRPFAGQSGQNLEIMLRCLQVLHPLVFPSLQLDAYSLVNAHSLPRYPEREGYDGSTQPRKQDVLAPENRARLIARLQRVQPEIIVYLGKAAQFAHEVFEAHMPDIRAYRTGHPSTQA
ncbi:MAG: uracil-DNA glycosylase family protein, partial [Marivita sp.]